MNNIRCDIVKTFVDAKITFEGNKATIVMYEYTTYITFDDYIYINMVRNNDNWVASRITYEEGISAIVGLYLDFILDTPC